MKNLALFIFAAILGISNSYSQGIAINTTAAAPHSSAILDVSSDSLGLLIPRMTEAERDDIVNPAPGLLICQTDNTQGFYYYNGTSWGLIGAGTFSINDLWDGKTGGNNVFLGSGAGASDNGSDNKNVATGIDALNANTTGEKNAANGYRALYSNTTGATNTANGCRALFFNLTGSSNTGYGFNVNGLNQNGSNNTIIGYEAGMGTALHDKSGNVFLGFKAGYNDTTDNKLYIENSDSSTPLIWGDFANDTVRINGTLDIAGVYHFPGVDGTSSQFLQTDGSGLLSWADDSGATEINELSDGKTINSSIYLGTSAGLNALGAFNVGIGFDALHDNDWGYENTAIGYHTLRNLENTGFNTAIGCYTLKNTIGNYNTAVGSGALKNIGGSCNTAIGSFTGYTQHSGDSNTYVGYLAGWGSSSYPISGSVFLGCMAGYYETTDNKLYIENSDSSTPLIWGDFDNDTVRINGTFDINGEYHFPDTIGNDGQMLQSDGSGSLTWKEMKYSVGDFAHGGIVFWVDNTGQHGLACTKEDQNTGIRWNAGTNGVTRAQGNGPFSGEMNTAIIISSQVSIGDDGNTYAANLCSKIQISQGGKQYGDWYLPSKKELNLMYLNKTDINITATANGGSSFANDYYWSSTEGGSNTAWMQQFSSGTQLTATKDQTYYVRAIRSF